MRNSPVSTNRLGFAFFAAFFCRSAVVSTIRPTTLMTRPTTNSASVPEPLTNLKMTGEVSQAYRRAALIQMAHLATMLMSSPLLISVFILEL